MRVRPGENDGPVRIRGKGVRDLAATSTAGSTVLLIGGALGDQHRLQRRPGFLQRENGEAHHGTACVAAAGGGAALRAVVVAVVAVAVQVRFRGGGEKEEKEQEKEKEEGHGEGVHALVEIEQGRRSVKGCLTFFFLVWWISFKNRE